MDYIFNVLALIGGLILFLYGMDLMGDGLKKLAGGKLESVLARLTSNRLKGFLLGFVVTAVIQSSSATTVMLVGFVNSGIMKLGQTISIIMGANIGTTVTSWLLSTADIGDGAFFLKLLKPDSFTPILALIGFLMTMSAKDRKKNTGLIFVGFAILMFGMNAMSDSVDFLKDNKTFTDLLVMFSNPVVGILVGTIFTAIIQSSSASVGVLQALALTCQIPYATAIPVILGQNIGTTITPILSALKGNTESKRVALSCLYIKMIGVVVVSVIFYVLNSFIGFWFMKEGVYVSAFNVAIIHTLFNIFSTVILMPFCSQIEKLAIKSVKSKQSETKYDVFNTLDERFLDVPSFAVEKCKELVCQMAEISKNTFKMATGLLDSYEDKKFEEIVNLESTVDKYEDKTSTYLVKIASKDMSTKDSRRVTELLHTIGDIERISDHALNIAEAAKEIYDKEIRFSQKATEDIRVITLAVTEILELTVNALIHDDIETLKNIEPLEQVIDDLKRKIKNGHITRLRAGDCTMELGFILSDILTNYERVSDHCSNIAVCFIEISHNSFSTHEYLNKLKTGDIKEFNDTFDMYYEKYSIKE